MAETRNDLELWWAEFFQPHITAALAAGDDFDRGQRLGFLLGRMTRLCDDRFTRQMTDLLIATSRAAADAADVT